MIIPTKIYPNEELTELGIERRCYGCGELWPLDSEFWQKNVTKDKRGYQTQCKACLNEKQVRRLRIKHPVWRGPKPRVYLPG